MVEKAEYIYSDVLKAKTYNEAYDVFIFNTRSVKQYI